MDLNSYLRRIGYSGPRSPTADTLRGLHLAHLQSVPFENLDIHAGRPIVLEEARLFEKIVMRRRGGFCYELNGLFAGLLRGLGFDVTMLSARVFDGGVAGPEFDHMALLVQLKERWLADVGFGDSFVEPLRLDDPGEQIQRGISYRIRRSEDAWSIAERKPGGDWVDMYRFTLQARAFPDYAPMCLHHQTSPEAHFTQKRTCSMATPDGRVTLTGMKLIVTSDGVRREQTMTSEADYRRELRSRFGID